VYTQNVTTPGTNLNALATSVSNHTTLIAGLTNVTQNQTSVSNVTNFAGDVTANRFVKDGGLSNQFLMADGSTLENSNSNANSNIYLYNSSTVHNAPPNSGEVRFSAPTNEASTVLWLNHLTRGGTDIHAFLGLITTLSVIYIQQENDAENYVKYNVTATPIFPEQHVFIQLDVTFLEGGGSGLTSFGDGTPIFISIFTNDREIDERLSFTQAAVVDLRAALDFEVVARETNVVDLSGQTAYLENRVNTLSQQHYDDDIRLTAEIARATNAESALTNGLALKLDSSLAASTYLTQASAANTYATLSSQNISRQAKQITSVVTNALVETIMTVSPTFGTYTWTDTAVGQSRKWKIQGIQSRSNFSATFTIRLKTNGTSNVVWILPASPSGAVTNQPFTLELTQVRQFTNSLSYYARFISPEATTAGYSLVTSQNQSGGVVGLNVSGAYTITVQSNLASGTLTFLHVDVTAVLG
jgi:hypothetical protein